MNRTFSDGVPEQGNRSSMDIILGQPEFVQSVAVNIIQNQSVLVKHMLVVGSPVWCGDILGCLAKALS